MSEIYTFRELTSRGYKESTKEGDIFTLSLVPDTIGLPNDIFPYKKYILPKIVQNLLKKLLEKYSIDESEIGLLQSIGVTFQYILNHKYIDSAGQELDKVKDIFQKLYDIYMVLDGNMPPIEKIVITIGDKEVVIDSWMFFAGYLPDFTDNIKSLSDGKILKRFEYDKYEEVITGSLKPKLYLFLEGLYKKYNTKEHGKYTFISIYIHIFQIYVSKQSFELCELTDNKTISDYKNIGDAIKKAIKRKKGTSCK
ncbi:hypothetical protein [Faecalibacter bovis]|uniref:Uncharacterized protein n=1 Tax=Faecalibacter bovis TaxID=2898187 RepID=A0ABX7XAC2_9FLAO|nr:hypothetical protein [Faecalibacter bovis]QTV04842.1 hypothetical protein J9309_08530 [Faecalibacter bovis]